MQSSVGVVQGTPDAPGRRKGKPSVAPRLCSLPALPPAASGFEALLTASRRSDLGSSPFCGNFRSDLYVSLGCVPYSESGIAVTWLELFISFTLSAEASLSGVPPPGHLSRDILRPRGSLKEPLETSKRLVRAIARAKVHPDQRHWFAPRGSATRLSCLGFGTRLACISAAPAWGAAHAQAVAERILSLRPRFRSDMVSRLRGGTLLLSPRNLSLLIHTPWSPSPSGSQTQGGTGLASHPGFFTFLCRPPCRSAHTLVGKPRAAASGAWPQVSCSACGITLRVGLLRCVRCSKVLRCCHCDCTPRPIAVKPKPDVLQLLLKRPACG